MAHQTAKQQATKRSTQAIISRMWRITLIAITAIGCGLLITLIGCVAYFITTNALNFVTN